ncbi:MAG: hypothetical protein JRD89_15680 [Deltaproteobacteria bacterium]|nr:hypothetical protein [Deltaproteobacteria bacterium]
MAKDTSIEKAAPEFGDNVMDFSSGMPLVAVEKQEVILAEYDKRRDHFRAWLRSHLIEGVHYGYPPGCKPTHDADGNIIQKYKDRNSNTWKTMVVPASQWKAKPSLYKAGALLIVDLLPIRPEYKTDRDAWEMNGSKSGCFFRTCTLHNATTGDYLGQGTGAFKVSEKGMQENSAIKMADKRALVAAVINTIPVVNDLFTQDMEYDENGAPKKKPDDRRANINDEPKEASDENATEWRGREADIDNLWQRIDTKRGGEGVPDKVFVDAVSESLFGDHKKVSERTLAEFRTLVRALGAGLFDWATGDKLPADADTPDTHTDEGLAKPTCIECGEVKSVNEFGVCPECAHLYTEDGERFPDEIG